MPAAYITDKFQKFILPDGGVTEITSTANYKFAIAIKWTGYDGWDIRAPFGNGYYRTLRGAEADALIMARNPHVEIVQIIKRSEYYYIQPLAG